ncbi:hypothetical protein HMPREF9141_0861 [Prevotella multiformis DSM 16608]|uniref:Uncharacterized protein n=1 Tax=Prevotella multiformis DSM 16608 TaxID=888743 RepID=F0F5J5_9BACT|nr:hypothetical protein HMPREF9141_0861 [Prevotella multiformis DSM 16608]
MECLLVGKAARRKDGLPCTTELVERTWANCSPARHKAHRFMNRSLEGVSKCKYHFDNLKV